jgi:hypothetical protein
MNNMISLWNPDPLASSMHAHCYFPVQESSQLIVAVDYTKSNEWTGKESFQDQCLHDLPAGGGLNPYEHVINILARTLSAFDDDGLINAIGFGDGGWRPRYPREKDACLLWEVMGGLKWLKKRVLHPPSSPFFVVGATNHFYS